MSEFNFCEIGLLPIKIGDGNYSAKYPKASEFINSGVPFISASDFKNRRISPKDFRYISPKQHSTLLKGHLKAGDVLIVSRGNGVGEVAWVEEKYDSANINAQLVLLRADNKIIYNKYLFYYLSSDQVKNVVLNFASGSAQPQLPLRAVNQILIKYPPLHEQKAIAHILGSLDDKIELNRQMNQTLEAMAQALFKSWFVDFDPVMDNALAAGQEIPDELQAMAEKRRVIANREERSGKQSASKRLINTNPELAELFPSFFDFNETLGKWIPEGWEVKKIKNTGKVITGKTPSSKNPEHFGNIYPFVTPTDFKDYFKLVINSDRKLSQEGYDENIKRILPEGSVIVTCIGSDMGKVVLTKTQCLTNQQINSVVTNIDLISSEYLFQFFQSNYDLLRTLAFGGSTMPILNKTDFENIDIMIPTKEVILKITNTLKSYDNKILSNLKQTETLIELRDRLLPELISGKVRVKEKILNNL